MISGRKEETMSERKKENERCMKKQTGAEKGRFGNTRET